MSNIRDILLLQKRELDRVESGNYIQREVDYKKFNFPLIKVIIGPRRAGKSFLAYHIIKKSGNFGYVNFDDERIIEMENYDEIITSLNSLYNNPGNFLFDEIQNLKNWELFVNRLHREGYNIIITGSNSNLLSKDLATHLTGRHIPVIIFPFSFKEYLKAEEKELTELEIRNKFRDYSVYGGYPEPLVKNIDYKDYLSTLFDSILFKDIVKKFNIRFVSGIEDLALFLISNVGKEFSYNTLTKLTKCKSVHTVQKYLNYFEEAFIFFRVNRFSYKLKQQILSEKKIYCIDPGFVYAKGIKLTPDVGRLYENVFAIFLKKLEMEGKIKFYYWKTPSGKEVDFVVEKERRIVQLIQVCYDLTDPKTKMRECASLISASKIFGCSNLVVLTDSYENIEEVEWQKIKREIKFIPLWKFLTGGENV